MKIAKFSEILLLNCKLVGARNKAKIDRLSDITWHFGLIFSWVDCFNFVFWFGFGECSYSFLLWESRKRERTSLWFKEFIMFSFSKIRLLIMPAVLSSEEEAHRIPIHANHSHNIRTREFWSSEQLRCVAWGRKYLLQFFALRLVTAEVCSRHCQSLSDARSANISPVRSDAIPGPRAGSVRSWEIGGTSCQCKM